MKKEAYTANQSTASHYYSHKLFAKNILIFGPYPPPLGGVSVHIERVTYKLHQQKNIISHFDTSLRPIKALSAVAPIKYICWLIYIIQFTFKVLLSKSDIIFYHTISLNRSAIELILLALLKKTIGFQLILIEHNCRHLYKRSELFKKILNYVLTTTDKLVLIGDITHKSYIQNKINIPTSTTIEGAFLPPDTTKEQLILNSYPSSLTHFINSHTPLITANAFQLVLLNDNDLYGIDMCINLISQLYKTFPKIGMLIALGQVGNKKYFEKLQKQIKHFNIENHVYFLDGQKVLWPILKKTDLFVRPTLSDSFGISVAEALYFGTTAIASDVCTRPHNTILFSTGNQMHFTKQVKNTLKKEFSEQVNKQHNHLHSQQVR